MASSVQPDISSERDTFFGVIPKSTLQIAFGACISFLEQYIGVALTADRLLGLLAPNVFLALASIGERLVQTLQPSYILLLLDHDEGVVEASFGDFELYEPSNQILDTPIHAQPLTLPDTPQNTDTSMQDVEPPLSSALEVFVTPDSPGYSSKGTITTALIIVCAISVGLLSAGFLLRPSAQTDHNRSEHVVERASCSSAPATTAASKTQQERNAPPTSGPELRADDKNSEGPSDDDPYDGDGNPPPPPPTSIGASHPRWKIIASQFIPTWFLLALSLGLLKKLVNNALKRTIKRTRAMSFERTENAKQPTATVKERQSSQFQSDELLGVGEQWDTLSGLCRTVPTRATSDTSAPTPSNSQPHKSTASSLLGELKSSQSKLTSFKNTLGRYLPLVHRAFTHFKVHPGRAIHLAASGTGLMYLAGTAFFVPAVILFYAFETLYLKWDNTRKTDSKNQLQRLSEAFGEDYDLKSKVPIEDSGRALGEEQTTSENPLILEEEDERECEFGHEPVLEYALYDDALQDSAALLRLIAADATSPSAEKVSNAAETKTEVVADDSRIANEEPYDESLIVTQEELADVFQADVWTSEPPTIKPREEDDELVTNLIVTAAQSSDSIVLLASSSSPQNEPVEPDSLRFTTGADQEAPLISIAPTGRQEEDDSSNASDDTASICSDHRSYVTAGDSDEEKAGDSPMMSDDEDLESYHSSVEDAEDDGVAIEACGLEVQESERKTSPFLRTMDTPLAPTAEQTTQTDPVLPIAPQDNLIPPENLQVVDEADQELATPTKPRKLIEEKDEESDGSLYEACPQKQGVRYIDDSDIDVDEPEPVASPSPLVNQSRIPRFSFGNNLFTSRSIHRFEVLQTLGPFASIGRAARAFDSLSTSARRSVSFYAPAASSSRVELEDAEPSLTPKGRMMKLKDKQLREKLKDMSGVKERENANAKRRDAAPRFSV